MSVGSERVGVRDTLHLEITRGETEPIPEEETEPTEPRRDPDDPDPDADREE